MKFSKEQVLLAEEANELSIKNHEEDTQCIEDYMKELNDACNEYYDSLNDINIEG